MRKRRCLARNVGARKLGRCGWAALLAVLVPCCAGTAAPVQVSDCAADGAETVHVAGVSDDLSLQLADGRTLVLAGVDPARATPDHPALASDARAKLDAWLAGRDVLARALAAGPDRWNRWPALVLAGPGAGDPPRLSVALAVVDAGLARARPEPAAHGCWPALLAAEQAARDGRLGLWADPYYAVRDASDATGLAGVAGDMALVQGRVTRVGRGRSWVFVDLDGDFTVRLGKRETVALARRGWDADRLKGARVRVRGLLDDRFGPGLDAVEADGIEVLDGPTPAGPAGR